MNDTLEYKCNRVSEWKGARMARRRFQRGQLLRIGDRWIARWREDVASAEGIIHRVRRKEVLGTIQDYPTKRLAQRALDDRLRPVNSEEYRPQRSGRFADFADRWMTSVMVHHKLSTQSSERSVIAKHLIPRFGELSFREISPEMLQKWVTSSTASSKTVRNIVTTLKVMWTTAKAWGYTSVNPFEGLRLPTAAKGNTYHFSVEEALQIIEAAEGEWKLFFRILAETGMRPGELAGLRVEDVSARSLRVSQSVWQKKVQTPKTASSVRSFAISDSLGIAIRHTAGGRSGLLFAAENGSPLSMDSFRQRVLGPILERLGIRAKVEALGLRCGNYAFRHMNMTELSRLGVPLKTIQKRVGHASGSEVTMTHYIHSVDADDTAAANMMGALLSPKGDAAVQ